ncbi:MAG TPA: hypothetical protein VHZ27_20080 [Solirubrobacteraceae bacterium]|nr:hypothetical protein [Solirubrobacteraceae bacterium]
MSARARVAAGLAVAIAVVPAGGAAIATATASAAATAAAAAQPTTTASRLAGTYQMSGRITAAKYVRGEHVGETLQRTWTFTPLCLSGPCAQVRVYRGRRTATDTLILTQTTPGKYAGTGVFYAPLECAGKVYSSGEEVPFTIKVAITATTTAPDGTVLASQITARYINTSRMNLTPCVIVLGHDAARYTGVDVTH